MGKVDAGVPAGGESDILLGEREPRQLPGETARGGVGGLAADGRTGEDMGVKSEEVASDVAGSCTRGDDERRVAAALA